MTQEACRAERKVLFIPSNYTIAWVLAMMMKESYLSSSQAKQKLKAITGTDFAHTAFNRKVSFSSTSKGRFSFKPP